MAQSVEHILGKDEVISSILISSCDKKTAEREHSAVFSHFFLPEHALRNRPPDGDDVGIAGKFKAHIAEPDEIEL